MKRLEGKVALVTGRSPPVTSAILLSIFFISFSLSLLLLFK